VGARSGGRIDPFQLVGTTLDRRFRIDAEIAEGGFGIVYRAYQITLDRPVALKVLKVPGDLSAEERSQFQRNFAAEARTIARLRHPSIVEVFDFGVSDGRDGAPLLWMALEWLDGRTLEDFLEAQRGEPPVSPAAALAFIRPAIETIAYAHSLNVVHRDLKPGNLMITTVHGARFLKVLDFGISKIMTAHERSERLISARTTRGAPAFSPAYAAPEQLAHGRTGPWTDVHAIGLILTELTTNLSPFGRGDGQIFEQVLSQQRPTPGRRGVDVGPWEPILQKAMALSPGERYSDAGALLQALTEALPEPRAEDRAVVPDLLTAIEDRTVVDVDARSFPETDTSLAGRPHTGPGGHGSDGKGDSESIKINLADDPAAIASRLTTPGIGPRAIADRSPEPLPLQLMPRPARSPVLLVKRVRHSAGLLGQAYAPTLRKRWPLVAGTAAAAVVLLVGWAAIRRSSDPGDPAASAPAVSVDRPGPRGGSTPGVGERRVQPGWEPLRNRAQPTATTVPEPAATAATPARRRYVLMLNSDPRGATVLIDGKPRGTTPTSVVSRRRRHSVVFQLPGHQEHRASTDGNSPWRRNDAGELLLELDARLDRAPAGAPASSGVAAPVAAPAPSK
jgi:eukaryotic-like serine/threonine-protein kinase